MTWILCHVPRTAGTSLKRTHPCICHQSDPHATAHQLRTKWQMPDARIFAVLRDPIDRAISLYHVQNGAVATPNRFLTWLQAAIKRTRASTLHPLTNGLPWWAPAHHYVLHPKTGELVVDKLLAFEQVIKGNVQVLGLPNLELAGRDKALGGGQMDRKRLYSDWPGVAEACAELYAGDYKLRERL